MILPGLWRDLGERAERVRNWTMRNVFSRFASINEFERCVTSQNGEDGIVAEIFRRIGTTNRYFVEFGVGDGHQCNTAQLVLLGWSGLMLEGDPVDSAGLAQRYANFSSVRTAPAFITAENIPSIFESYNVPKVFDLLSIDIDGNDYWVWRALSGYQPRAVIIEYNASYPPPEKWVMAYNAEHKWDGTTYHGASLSSLAALGASLGYALIGTDNFGVNAFFLRRALTSQAHFHEISPERAYHPPGFYGPSGDIGHPRRSGPSAAIEQFNGDA